MKLKKILGGALVAASLTGAVAPASATSWFDFSQATNLVTITSSNFNNATVLRRVTARCPANGYLVASAEAGFTFSSASYPNKGWVRLSIGRTDVGLPNGIDASHYRNVQAYQTRANHSQPGGMMRIDRCTKNQSITYHFLGQKVHASSARAWQPRLVVEYFNRRI